MKVVIFDFEVFKYDTLLGAIVLENSSEKLYQLWNLDEIRNFYLEHKDDLWVGHNITTYDNLILESIVMNENPYEKSQKIIHENARYLTNLHLIYYDLMSSSNYYSLKACEAVSGKNISESQVDFTLDRPLTEDEKLKTESYNRDDLQQTKENFLDKENIGDLKVKLDVMSTFGLDYNVLHLTGTRIAEIVLKAKKIKDIDKQYVAPKIYDCLQLKNQDLIDFYMSEGFRKNQKLVIHIGNAAINIGSGGAHSAIKKFHTQRALYFDVSGYYNLTMINFDLLPRSLPKESKELYVELYHKQLEYKKTDPAKRATLKVILLSVFGAEMSPYSKLYDPQRGSLVTITGQLFICDLLEKLQDKVNIIQTNTDGIIVEPFDWNKKDEVIQIVEEWENRTGYVIKKVPIFDIWQRDVNNYFYKDESGNIHTKGEIVKQYETDIDLFHFGVNVNFKEPVIIAKCIVESLINHKTPEEVVESYKNKLQYFQYICKRLSFDYTEYELYDTINNTTTTTRLQGINRAFAYNDKRYVGMIYKHKLENGKDKKAKISNLPESVFVYDDEILSDKAVEKVSKMIDYQYYINRAYERIDEFLK